MNGYLDSDYVGFANKRKSTFECLFLLAGEEISWMIVKHSVMDVSTMEAKFVTCFEDTI